MEHGIILLIEAILAADRKLQKPLGKHLPDFQNLLSEPREYLSAQEILIGPRRSYAVSIVLGLIVAGLAWLVFAVMRDVQPKPAPLNPSELMIFGICLAVTAIASASLLLRWLRGGAAVVGKQGVQFFYRGRTLFCPWELFRAPGTAYHPDHGSVILPVDESVPVASSGRDGEVQALAVNELRGRPLISGKDSQIILPNIFEVRAGDLGELLLFLGSRLASPAEANTASVGRSQLLRNVQPLAVAEEQGWLRIRLTQLPFPPVCVSCGGGSYNVVSMPLGQKGQKLEVPLCLTCQRDGKSRDFMSTAYGVGGGIVVFLISAALLRAFGGRAAVPMIVASLIFLPVIGALIAFVLRQRSAPLKLKSYRPAEGTVLIRPRDGAGGEAFRQVLLARSDWNMTGR